MSQPTLLVAINDIFFYTKVRDALVPEGYRLEKSRTQEDIAGKAATHAPAAILLDMNDRAVDAFQALQTVRQDPRFQAIPILAYANHEDVDTWIRAKALGVTKIVSRNEFSARTRELVEEVTKIKV